MHYRTFSRPVAYAIGLALSLWTSSALGVAMEPDPWIKRQV
jgi:hypothetical protein